MLHAPKIGKERNHQALCLYCLQVFVELCQDTKVVKNSVDFLWALSLIVQ